MNEICGGGVNQPYAQLLSVSVADMQSKQKKVSPREEAFFLFTDVVPTLKGGSLRAPLISLPAILIGVGSPLHLSHLCGCLVLSAIRYWIRASQEEKKIQK